MTAPRPNYPCLPFKQPSPQFWPDPQIVKYMHNAKFDMTVLERHGMPVEPPIFDTMIASWLGRNAPGVRHGLKDLVKEALNIQMTEIKALIGTGKKQITMDRVPIGKATPYAAADVDMTLRLAEQVEQPLRAGEGQLWHIFESLELPLIYVLKDMELAGIKLDVDALRQMSSQMARRLAELGQEIHRAAGVTFNVNSTQQLSDVLFDRLKLPTAGLKKTKSGHYSTAAGVLEQLRGQHPIIDLILEQRTLAKLISTYVDALPALVNPQNRASPHQLQSDRHFHRATVEQQSELAEHPHSHRAGPRNSAGLCGRAGPPPDCR